MNHNKKHTEEEQPFNELFTQSLRRGKEVILKNILCVEEHKDKMKKHRKKMIYQNIWSYIKV